MATEPPVDSSTTGPDPDAINSRDELATALSRLKGSRTLPAITSAAGDLTRSQAQEATGRLDWKPEALPGSTVSDWLRGRTLPTGSRLLTFLVVCQVSPDDIGRWVAAVERVRSLPAGSSKATPVVTPAPTPDSSAPPAPRPRRSPRLVLAAIVAVVVAAGITLFAVNASSNHGGGASPSVAPVATPGSAITVAAPATAAPITPSPSSAPPSSAPPDSSVPTSQAAITAVYDVPDGCSTTYTITGDLHGDPRAAGGKALWVAAVLSAPPNVLYYPKMRVTPQDGRFTVTIPANTEPGERTGRFGLIFSPTDRADADLQTSLQSDEVRNDSLYPDTRRVRLQAGNVELASTPFATQRC